MGQFNISPDLNEILKDIKKRLQSLANTLPTTTIQTGDIIPSAARTRTGCLPCDGSTYPTSSYPALAAKCPDYVSGGNITVPDCRGRTLIGAGTGTAAGATAHALGQTPTTGAGGEETHTLSAAESGLPAHTHVVQASAQLTAFTGTGGTLNAGAGTNLSGTSGSGVGTALANTATPATNGHNIMQPTTAVNWFIKT